MKESSKLPLFDLKKLNASLPVPSMSKNSIQLLIMGSSDDFIVVSDCIFLSLNISLTLFDYVDAMTGHVIPQLS